MNRVIKFIISIGVSLGAGAVGSLATVPNIPTWYATLEKPIFNPPNWVFGPVWTLLYILMGISLYLVWTSKSKQSKQLAYIFFGLQLLLNTLWSIIFFGLQQPWLAVIVIVMLLLAIIATIQAFSKFSRTAALLLAPYVAWVSFATILNLSVAILN